ncbi:RNA polymerase sigma-70 factor, ECF subfamily [Mucilaginibacter sp. OK268]|uniref:RNA polymerase sigma factor n=1 Tax=Mucilaginibacter sp. OK268 TaxID=1881048 RepID=UPI00088C2FA0|nr:RNA polymerase sigma-70 factor [Mucilaginibacter sp. OK268]SDP44454.1 RNA polymerase sigma-70 factor, ECF subfamily [Mucilaginibacter sp. OK268]
MALNSPVNERELLASIADGDHHAFTLLYKQYWPLLYLHVYRMLDDEELAGDVVQETFAWFWQNASSIRLTGSISSYLYSAIRNHVFNLIRREKVKSDYLKDLSVFIEEGYYQVEDELRYQELVNEIESEIDRMPLRMREVFNLSRKELLSHKQIAEKLNISESTVREQVKRALKILRVKLKDRPYVLMVFIHLLR